MSLHDVTSRIATLEQQLQLLRMPAAVVASPAGTVGVAASGASAFGTALDGALGALPTSTTTTGTTTGTTGTTGALPAGTVTRTADLPETGSLADLGLTSASGDAGRAVVDRATTYLGIPYLWGGTDPARGLDCSGLVQRVYRDLGVELPRVSRDQAREGTPVASLAQARPGDLVAFGSPVHHIGIYAGDHKMVEAPRTGLDVRIAPITETPTAIRRVLGGAAPLTGAAAASAVPYAGLFTAAGAAHGVDADLLAAVARQESGFDPRAVSPAGAQGLMQLMPATARGLGVSDSFEPAQAVDGAARLLRGLLDRFGRTDLALAAYNAGPGAVLRYDGVPPYPETQAYVRSVLAAVGAGS